MIDSKTRVVHCKKEQFNIYIGRPSKWSNPFKIGRDGSRQEVIQKYKDMIIVNIELIKQIPLELKGKTLGCWCKPYQCHGDVLAELAGKN
jgi:uncharacterized protein DUF4326